MNRFTEQLNCVCASTASVLGHSLSWHVHILFVDIGGCFTKTSLGNDLAISPHVTPYSTLLEFVYSSHLTRHVSQRSKLRPAKSTGPYKWGYSRGTHWGTVILKLQTVPFVMSLKRQTHLHCGFPVKTPSDENQVLYLVKFHKIYHVRNKQSSNKQDFRFESKVHKFKKPRTSMQ